METAVPLFSAALRDRKGRTESALTLSRGASLYTKLKQLLNMDWEYSLVMECLPSVLKALVSVLTTTKRDN